jgi:hypothetical protein
VGKKFRWIDNHKIRQFAMSFNAFNYEFMEDNEDGIKRFGMDMIAFLWKYGVQELIIIFEGDSTAYDPDLVLTSRKLLHSNTSSNMVLENLFKIPRILTGHL